MTGADEAAETERETDTLHLECRAFFIKSSEKLCDTQSVGDGRKASFIMEQFDVILHNAMHCKFAKYIKINQDTRAEFAKSVNHDVA